MSALESSYYKIQKCNQDSALQVLLTHSLTHTSYSNYRLLLAKIKWDSTTGTNLYGSSLTCGGSFGVLTAQGSGASSASTTLVG